jgi:hypothetical protein
MKNSNDIIGNRSRDLPVCSTVPQPLCHRVPPLPTCTSRNLWSRNVAVSALTPLGHLDWLAVLVYFNCPVLLPQYSRGTFNVYFNVLLTVHLDICMYWDQLDTLFIFSLFCHSTSTFFGLASCPSSGGNTVYI